jgi:hypothetical protein
LVCNGTDTRHVRLAVSCVFDPAYTDVQYPPPPGMGFQNHNPSIK